MFDDFLISMPLSNPVVKHYLRRAKYIDQSRAGGISAITGSSGGNDSRKRHEKRLIFKIETFIHTGLTNDFLLFDHIPS